MRQASCFLLQASGKWPVSMGGYAGRPAENFRVAHPQVDIL